MPWDPEKRMIVNKYGKDVHYRGGRQQKVYLAVIKRELCRLFNISTWTLARWINEGILSPDSLESICTLYMERYSRNHKNATSAKEVSSVDSGKPFLPKDMMMNLSSPQGMRILLFQSRLPFNSRL